LRRTIRTFRPDVMLSFLDTINVMALAATRGLSVPLVAAERTDPERNPLDYVRRSLRDSAYRRVPFLVVQSERAASYFPPAMQPRIRVLPNPVFPASAIAAPGDPGPDGRFRVVAVGRFTPEKRLELLIRAFARAAATRPDWDLAIFGDGPLRSSLERLKGELGMAARVMLPGLTQDVAADFARSHIAVLPSAFEGFPNALGEALAAGLPGVAFAGIPAVEEMIVPGETGLLLEESAGEEALAAALGTLMDNPADRVRMGAAARQHVRRWAPERVLAAWEDLLCEAAATVAK
jgi:glycosyltransferase involved in cell wall biosynthesis